MLKIYLTTIVLFYLSYILFVVRCFVNKNEKITVSKNNEKLFVFLRLLVLSLIPIINIFFTIYLIKVSILNSNENFIKMLNEYTVWKRVEMRVINNIWSINNNVIYKYNYGL